MMKTERESWIDYMIDIWIECATAPYVVKSGLLKAYWLRCTPKTYCDGVARLEIAG